MTVTVLAILFLVGIVAVTLFGRRILSKQIDAVAMENRKTCMLCRKEFDKKELIERQIGDYKLLYFCTDCIQSLANDLDNKPTSRS